jgi:alpha-L-fucosidase
MRRALALVAAILVFAGLAVAGPGAIAGQAAPEEPTVRGVPGAVELSEDADVAAWQRLQYGMFIHWGLFSELGGVWQGEPVTRGYSEQIQMWANISEEDYLEVAKRFRPERFDPAEICSLAKRAGMRYIVITSKHHDGFSMFDTDSTTYDIVDSTPYGKDPMRALADECRSQGLKFGFYFSLVDWHQGHAFASNNSNPIPASMEPVIKQQIRELMTNYGDIAEVWFDMSAPTADQSAAFASIVREHQPHAAINSRVWNNKGDFRTLGDNEVPDVPLDGAWQTPASIYHETWGYRSWQKRDDLPGKVRDLVTGLTSVRARGGNYLLNIGPRGDGSVVEFEADVLRGIGDWLSRHPGAVLDASATRFGGQPWGEVTVNGRELFLHVTDWPADRQLRLPGLATAVQNVREDGAASRLDWRFEGDDLVVTLPEQPRDEVLPVIQVDLAGELRVIPRNTIDLGSDTSAVIQPADIESGHSYADQGNYDSNRRTTVRNTAHITTRKSSEVSIAVAGQARPDASYRVTVGHESRVVRGSDLTTNAIGPFQVLPRVVTPVTVRLDRPTHPGEDLGLRIDTMLVGQAGTVVSWLEAPDLLEQGASADIPVHVTNLGTQPASGATVLRTPEGWQAGAAADYTNLAPGGTFTTAMTVSVPATTPLGNYTLTADATGGGSIVELDASVRVVQPNVAVGKTATQISTAWEGVPSRAVDGNTKGAYFDGSVTHTAEPSHQAWWQVDLGESHAIGSIEVWNRTDCCSERLSDYWVLVSDTPFTTDSLDEAKAAPGVTARHLAGTAGRPTTVDLGGAKGRYVRVQLTSPTNPLTLAEVIVRAEPAA